MSGIVSDRFLCDHVSGALTSLEYDQTVGSSLVLTANAVNVTGDFASGQWQIVPSGGDRVVLASVTDAFDGMAFEGPRVVLREGDALIFYDINGAWDVYVSGILLG